MSNKCREDFEKWFLEKAKAPIDPWHKKFAWSVWQAALATPQAADEGIIDKIELLHQHPHLTSGDYKFQCGFLDCLYLVNAIYNTNPEKE